jgi:hypothetical protein
LLEQDQGRSIACNNGIKGSERTTNQVWQRGISESMVEQADKFLSKLAATASNGWDKSKNGINHDHRSPPDPPSEASERLADPVANLGGIRTLADAVSKALVLEMVPASLRDLNSRLAAGDW